MNAARLSSLLLGLVGLLAGCIPQGVPLWAMHVQPHVVDPTVSTKQLTARLTTELSRRTIGHEHIAPEQIALVAVQELERGRLSDAGLWLSIASYRYHQEALLAEEKGRAGADNLDYNVDVRQYAKLVIAEIRQFANLEFYDEQEVITARLLGHDAKEVALQEQLAALGKTDASDRESLRDLWSELRPKTADPIADSHYPALTEAFRVQLRSDAAARPKDRNPAIFLGRSDSPALKKEAIFSSPLFFEPSMCVGIADAFPLLRPEMVAALTAKRPQARANAAATLALAPTDETRGLLQARLAVETNQKVRLVVAYALARHGVGEQVLPLVTALQSCQDEDCALPATLVQWLPMALKADVDQSGLARVVGDSEIVPRARLYAAAALRSIATRNPLTPAAVEALIAAGRARIERAEQLQFVASEAVQEAAALSRKDILARLRSGNPSPIARADVKQPCALVARLAKVSLPEDLPLLRELMLRLGDSEGAEPQFILQAVLNIRGQNADATLINWFKRYKRLQSQIAIGLVERDSVSRDALRSLVARGDAFSQLAVKTMLKDTDAQTAALGFLASENLRDKVQAAEMVGLTGQTAAREELTSLLSYRDEVYYPSDALVRHTAMSSILRLALLSTRPASPKKPELTQPAAPSPPEAVPASDTAPAPSARPAEPAPAPP